MADDIVKRLWHTSAYLRTMEEADTREAIEDAADEIERLRAELDAERVLADRLAGALLDGPFRGGSLLRRDRMYGSGWEDVHNALDAWESRRKDSAR